MIEDFLGGLYPLQIRPPLLLALAHIRHVAEDADTEARGKPALGQAHPAVAAAVDHRFRPFLPERGDLACHPVLTAGGMPMLRCRGRLGRVATMVEDRAEDIAQPCAAGRNDGKRRQKIAQLCTREHDGVVAIIQQHGTGNRLGKDVQQVGFGEFAQGRALTHGHASGCRMKPQTGRAGCSPVPVAYPQPLFAIRLRMTARTPMLSHRRTIHRRRWREAALDVPK